MSTIYTVESALIVSILSCSDDQRVKTMAMTMRATAARPRVTAPAAMLIVNHSFDNNTPLLELYIRFPELKSPSSHIDSSGCTEQCKYATHQVDHHSHDTFFLSATASRMSFFAAAKNDMSGLFFNGALFRLPDLHGILLCTTAVSAAGGDVAAVRRPGEGVNIVLMAPVGEDVAAVEGIPHLHGIIKAACRQVFAVGRPRDGLDLITKVAIDVGRDMQARRPGRGTGSFVAVSLPLHKQENARTGGYHNNDQGNNANDKTDVRPLARWRLSRWNLRRVPRRRLLPVPRPVIGRIRSRGRRGVLRLTGGSIAGRTTGRRGRGRRQQRRLAILLNRVCSL